MLMLSSDWAIDMERSLEYLRHLNGRLCDQVEIFDAVAAASTHDSINTQLEFLETGTTLPRRQKEQEKSSSSRAAGTKFADIGLPNPSVVGKMGHEIIAGGKQESSRKRNRPLWR